MTFIKTLNRIQHFIITRFNIKNPKSHWKKDRYDQKVLTANWLDKRFQIFENYCLQSILQQSNKNFLWLIYFDPKTPKKYLERLKKPIYNDLLKLIFVKDYNEFMNRVGRDCKNYLSKDTKQLITTRLDNDDCLHKDAIQIIQSDFLKNKGVLNLTNGFCLKIEPYNFLTEYHYPNGPFMSMIESVTNEIPKTIITYKHGTFKNIRQIIGPPLWVQIIHDTNLSNQVIGKPILNNSQLIDFGISPKQTQLNMRAYPKYFLLFLLRAIKQQIRIGS